VQRIVVQTVDGLTICRNHTSPFHLNYGCYC